MVNENITKESKIFKTHPFFYLFLIGITAIIIRLFFINWDIPLSQDAFLYFRYAIDVSLLNSLPENFFLHNNGWPIFLSFFFSLTNSENYLDYMNLQKILSIVLSTLTIIPIYYICKKFFKPNIAIVGSSFFILEPRIIQNSLLGITEPFYILIISTATALVLDSRQKVNLIGFALVGISTIVRSEALFVLAALSIVYFLNNPRNRKTILRYGACMIIFALIVIPISVIRIQEQGQDSITSRVTEAVGKISNQNEVQENGSIIQIMSGLQIFGRFLTFSMIPIWIFFVPVGLLFFKNQSLKKYSILVIGIFLLLSALAAYVMGNILDYRYLFPLYFVFSIISCFVVNQIYQKIPQKKMLAGIIVGVSILSISFLGIIQPNAEHEKELLEINKIVYDKTDVIYTYNPESKYLETVALSISNNFPIVSSEYNNKVKQIRLPEIFSLEEIMQYGYDRDLTHLVLDENKDRTYIFQEIFISESKFPFLLKEWDSKNGGFEYHVKIFKIDWFAYEEYLEKMS